MVGGMEVASLEVVAARLASAREAAPWLCGCNQRCAVGDERELWALCGVVRVCIRLQRW